MTIYGWWLLSTPDPGQLFTNKGNKPRRLLRGATIIMGVCIYLHSVLTFMHTQSLFSLILAKAETFSAGPLQPDEMLEIVLALISGFAWVVEWIAWIVIFFVSLNYLRWLASRIPSARMYKSAERFRWLGPLIYVVGSLCLQLGPLVAMVLYYNLFNTLRIVLKKIRAKVARPTAVAV